MLKSNFKTNVILATLGGILIGLCFPEYNLSWFVFFGLAPTLISYYTEVSLKKRLLFLLITGFVSNLLAFPWVIHSAVVYGHIPLWLSVIGYVIYSLITGLYIPFIMLPLLLTPKELVFKRWWIICAGMTFLEFLTPNLFLWTFGNLAFKNIFFIQAVDIFGSFGLGFFIFLGNFVVAFLVLQKWKGSIPYSKVALWASVGAIVVVHIYGVIRYYQLEKKFSESEKTLHLGLVQPNFSLERLSSNRAMTQKEKFENLDRVVQQSLAIEKDHPETELLLWPESTFGFVYDWAVDVRNIVSRLARATKASVLLTTLTIENPRASRKITANPRRKVFSSSYLIGPSGEVSGRYHKMFLIPFGETIPFADKFPAFREFLESFVDNISQFDVGTEYITLPVGKDKKIIATICFDVLDPQIVRNLVRAGGEIVINQANFAWFGRGGAPGSVLQLLRFRGMENRTPTALVANSGYSIVMDAMGNYKTKRAELFVKDRLYSPVKLAPTYSFYREYGNLFVWLMGLFSFVYFTLRTFIRKGWIPSLPFVS